MHDPDIEGYDIIGDVHGCAVALQQLLTNMGYKCVRGTWCHPARKAVFVGDIIDRGDNIREAMNLVRRMVDEGQAHLVLGNHEFNAIVYSSPFYQMVSPALQRYYGRLCVHLSRTLQDYRYHLPEWKSTIAWFRQLPLCLEFEGFRVVHACWDEEKVVQARQIYNGCALQDETFARESLNPVTGPSRIIERLLKGTDLILPDGKTLLGADGIRRNRFRTKFWQHQPKTYGDVVFQPDILPDDILNRPLSESDRKRLLYYPADEKPLFIGHYWRIGTPSLICDNIACLDYSAVKQGLLVAYRMGKEQKLHQQGFSWVRSDGG